jgi:hypothetical protein
MTRVYEIRVEGELGEPFLQYLQCGHCVLPEQMMVRVDATPEEFDDLLQSCSDLGLTIESVRRVSRSPAQAPGNGGEGADDSA